MSTISGSNLSNKKSQQRSPDGGKSTFRTKGQSGQADMHPGGDMGKGMGQLKPKQAKYGKRPDKDAAGTGSRGPESSAAYHRSGGTQN